MDKNPNGEKTASLALDLVEPGTDLIAFDSKHTSREAPDGVSSKLLYRDVLRIAWPSFVELTLTQLASMADLMMVGQLGSWAITSVGLANQPKMLLMTMYMAMNVGVTALVARNKGAGNQKRANLMLRQGLLLTFFLAITTSILGYIFAEPLIQFMGATDAQTLAGGTVYLQIQAVGLITVALTSTVTAALRGAGNSRTAMYYNLTSNLVNVILNYILIYGHFGFPKMGVAGASLATILGQLVACIMAFCAVTGHKNYVCLKIREGFKPNKQALASIFKIGMPAMVEQLVMRAGVIMYSKTVASLGTAVFATHQVCMNIQALSFMNGQAFAVSATSLVGQSLGKRRPDMAQAYSYRTRRVGMVVSFVLMGVFLFFGRPIVSMYTAEADVIKMGASILMFVAAVQPFQASQFILAGALRGAGDTRATAIITFITVLLVRPGLAIIMVKFLHWGLPGAWVALVSDQLLRSLLVWVRFSSGKWKEIKA